MQRIVFFLNNLNIRNKLFLILFLIVFASTVISLSIMDVTFNIYNRLLYQQSVQILNLSTSNIEEYLKKIEKLSYSITTSNEIQMCTYWLKHTESDYLKNSYLKQMSVLLTSYSISETNIPSISFIDNNNNQMNRGSSPKEYGKETRDMIIQSAVSSRGKDVIIPFAEEKNTVLIARMIRRVDSLNLESLGIIVIKCDLGAQIENELLEVESNQPDLTVLYKNSFIYKSGTADVYEPQHLRFKNSSGYAIELLDGRKCFISHNTSNYTGWTYISITPYESVFKSVVVMRIIVFILFFLLFIFTMFIGIRLARSFTRPLEQLTHKMKQVEKGMFKIEWDEAGWAGRQDEIGQLNEDFRIMIKKIETLITEDYVKQLLIKDTQLMALQAQINPHFLYNTLESINWLAKLNHQQDISKMAESLGSLMRGAINNKDRLVSLREEVKLSESYIAIQKIRYEERLDFRMEKFDEVMAECKVPKLILQPLLENAIHYGLEKMLGTCVIEVEFLKKDDCFLISVQDNGPGIEPETLQRIKIWDIKPNGLGIGLKNINDRLQLVFGEKYGIEVFSEPGKGTRVQINILYDAGEQNV